MITSNPDADRNAAEDVLDVKMTWPRAMQTRDAALFDRILSNTFSFRAHGRLYDKDEYIPDRMGRREEVKLARYSNVVLQVFGSLAVYSVELATAAGGDNQTWYGTWADVLPSRGGRWKIGASYLISER